MKYRGSSRGMLSPRPPFSKSSIVGGNPSFFQKVGNGRVCTFSISNNTNPTIPHLFHDNEFLLNSFHLVNKQKTDTKLLYPSPKHTLNFI